MAGGFQTDSTILYKNGAIDLDAAGFSEAIVRDGNSGEIWRGLPCPCVRPDSRIPRLDCSICKGVGYAYPLSMREPTMYLDTSRSGSNKVGQAGLVVSGSITLSIAPCRPLTSGDLIRPDDEVHVVTERMWHGNAPTNTPHDLMRAMRIDRQVPLAQRAGRPPRLLYPAVGEDCIDAVVYIRDDELVEASASDYRVLEGGYFAWLGDAGPPPGLSWSVRYQAPATYMVQGTMPMYRQQGGGQLPWRVVAQRYDRVSQNDGSPE